MQDHETEDLAAAAPGQTSAPPPPTASRQQRRYQRLGWGLRLAVVAALALADALCLCRPINLTRVDLGRHLKNGQLLVQALRQGDAGLWHSVLHSNHYAMTTPDFGVVNHHWLTGVIFHLTEVAFGFEGLSGLLLLLSVASFLLLFHVARRRGGFGMAVLLSVLLIPVLAERYEVRPEAFSLLFASLYVLVLEGHAAQRWRRPVLWVLPLCQLLWANLHIYFVFGLFLITCFLLEALARAETRRTRAPALAVTLGATALASLCTPFGLDGLLFPFQILNNYGYQILENQTVFFLQDRGLGTPAFLPFKVASALLVASATAALLRRNGRFPLAASLIGLVFCGLAWWALRNFAIFAAMALPATAWCAGVAFPSLVFLRDARARGAYAMMLGALTLLVATRQAPALWTLWRSSPPALGLCSGVNDAAIFFRQAGLRGPVFNNYDNGAYLIYHLHPDWRVFTDNRPEAYPETFFREVYIPLQDDEVVWQRREHSEPFNVIFFSHRDQTPWAQKFLVARLQDPSWAPVFADGFSIILLRRTVANDPIIQRYLVPQQRFRIAPSPR